MPKITIELKPVVARGDDWVIAQGYRPDTKAGMFITRPDGSVIATIFDSREQQQQEFDIILSYLNFHYNGQVAARDLLSGSLLVQGSVTCEG